MWMLWVDAYTPSSGLAKVPAVGISTTRLPPAHAEIIWSLDLRRKRVLYSRYPESVSARCAPHLAQNMKTTWGSHYCRVESQNIDMHYKLEELIKSTSCVKKFLMVPEAWTAFKGLRVENYVGFV